MTIYSLDILLFPILIQSVVPCPVLTFASWFAYRFLKRQFRWSGIPIPKNFPQFGIVNETEVDVLLEFSCFFYDPVDVGNLISGSSAFSKSSLNIWKFMYCWSLAWRILSITVLHSICQQIWKIQQWPQDWKRSVFISIPKKGNAKECPNYHRIALSHTLVK